MENRALKEFDKNIESLTKKDTIALCPDLDADGISAGAITYIALKKIVGKKPIVIIQPYKTTQILPTTLKKLKEKKANKLVIVDFAFDQSKENAQTTEKKI